MRTEAAIKSALIDRLFEKNEVCDDAVLISEMVVDRWTRRADVVLANGKLSAFEIKSDFDSLVRLKGQLESYCATFEKVVVVVAPRFAAKVTEMVPPGVGVWVADGEGATGIKEVRRAKIEPLSSEACLALMTVTDLRALLAANGRDGLARAPRQVLEDLARSLTKKDLQVAAREAVKRRFRAHHKRFISKRASRGTLKALSALKRPQRAIVRQEQVEHEVILPEVEVAPNHPLLIKTASGSILRRLQPNHQKSSSSSGLSSSTCNS